MIFIAYSKEPRSPPELERYRKWDSAFWEWCGERSGLMTRGRWSPTKQRRSIGRIGMKLIERKEPKAQCLRKERIVQDLEVKLWRLWKKKERKKKKTICRHDLNLILEKCCRIPGDQGHIEQFCPREITPRIIESRDSIRTDRDQLCNQNQKSEIGLHSHDLIQEISIICAANLGTFIWIYDSNDRWKFWWNFNLAVNSCCEIQPSCDSWHIVAVILVGVVNIFDCRDCTYLFILLSI